MSLQTHYRSLGQVLTGFRDMADYWSIFLLSRGNVSLYPQVQNCNIRPKETRNIHPSYNLKVFKHFDMLNHLGGTNECDRQTDFAIARAVHHYIAWPKNQVQLLSMTFQDQLKNFEALLKTVWHKTALLQASPQKYSLSM